MATVPQRELRNNSAQLLRRVERGERMTITVHGRPVAELAPPAERRGFVPLSEVIRDIGGLLAADDPLDDELPGLLAGPADDPFDRYEETERERPRPGIA